MSRHPDKVIMILLPAFLWLIIPVAFAQNGTDGDCVKVDLDTNTRSVCEPCEPSKWFELILQQRAEILNETTCFNNFPLGTHLPFTCPQDLTKGHGHPILDLTKTPRGFIMTKLPFFRYNTELQTKPDCVKCDSSCKHPNPPPTSQESVLDIGHVEPYYKDNLTMPSYSVDFEVLEWPGRTTDDQRGHLKRKLEKECEEGKFKSHKPALCLLKGPKGELGDFHMLKFQKESSKMLHYPCNKEEGTSIVALGLIAVYDETENDEHPHSKIFLSYSNQSIFNAHGHPLYVSDLILNQMAKSGKTEPRGICRKASEEPKDCDFSTKRDFTANPLTDTSGECEWRQKYFQDRGDLIMDHQKCQLVDKTPDSKANCEGCTSVPRALTGDLRTVLDFTFVQGRLILGMRCGIIIVSDFLRKQLNIKAATLLSSTGKHKNTFPAINKIASSFCCKKAGCRRTLIAAYSSYSNRGVDVPKELYVSFDLGDTFKTKLIAEHNSALNLIWGMYKLYGSWLLYYQLLDHPDTEDLKNTRGEELHPGYIDLRAVPDWNSLTLAMKEKRFFFGETTSESHIKDLEVRKRAMRRYIKLRTEGALGRFVRYRRLGREIEVDLAPSWLQQEIRNIRSSASFWNEQWTDSNCDSIQDCRKNFINDPAVAYFLKLSNVVIKTPRKSPEESFCDQIMSIAVLEEEDALYVLCRVGFGDYSEPFKNNSGQTTTSCSSRNFYPASCKYPLHPTTGGKPSVTYPFNECATPIHYHAIYSFSVKEKLPLVIIDERRSERLFTCKSSTIPLDWTGCKNAFVAPELVRVPSSVTLLVKNCQEVLYYSPNGGRTMFHTQFYAHQSEFAGTSNVAANCTQANDCSYNINSTSDQRQLMYRIKSLDVPPLIEISPSKNVVFMTMRNTYAYGLLGINKEFRMVVGKIFPNISANIISTIRSNDFVFPGFTEGGLPFFGVALKLVYSHNKLISCALYSNRHGMRLVHMDFFFFKDVSYYYEENEDMDAEARNSKLGVSVCNTYGFSAKPRYLALDVNEAGIVEVTSFDRHPNIHLGLVSSEEKSILVDVSFVDRQRKEKEHLAHDWDIHVNAIRNYKPRLTALVDSFFGAENSNMFGFYTEIGLANNVEFRCHVQPAATVSVHIECRNKRLVVHEDEHRPQCKKGTFSKAAFEYRLKRGEFNPNLAGYWMGLDEKDGKQLIKLDRETGDLIIVYDYLRFGCPLEPYKDETFVPDLRIATADTNFNSSLGTLYNGSFLLIELFGSKGFAFRKKYEDYGCTHVPLNLTNATEEWVHRQRMFRLAYGKQVSLKDEKEINNAKSIEEIEELEYGDQLFIPDAVDHPINIVNRVTYRDCKMWRSFFRKTENDSFPKLSTLSEEEQRRHLAQPLPILERLGENKITWSKRSQEVYIFMAIALDPTESLCEYYTIFGVHLPEVAEIDALITLLVFIILLILWIILFICGYMCRKSRIRTLCIQAERKRRLEEAAWKVVYQYEKLLQECENRKLEEEFREFNEQFNVERPADEAKLKAANAHLHKTSDTLRSSENFQS